MNNRHLPAGQAMDGGAAASVGMSPGINTGTGTGPGTGGGPPSGPGPSPGPRRGGRPPSYQHPQHSQHYNGGHHQQPHHHPQHVNMQAYPNYMNPYPAYGYPHSAPIPPPYQNGAQYHVGGMPSQAAYMYAQYGRSPPSMHHQYGQMMGAGAMQQHQQQQQQQQPGPPSHSSQLSYSRNQQQSPIVVSTPYQTPPQPPRTMSHNHAPVVQSVPQASLPQASAPSTQIPSRPVSQASPFRPVQAPPPVVAQVSPQVPAQIPAQVPAQVPAQATTPTPQPSAVATSAPPPPESPSSSLSTQAAAPAPPLTPPTPQTVDTPIEQPPSPKQPLVKLSSPKAPFRAPLPWYTHPDSPFPSRANKSKRRRRVFTHEAAEDLQLPFKNEPVADASQSDAPIADSAATLAPSTADGAFENSDKTAIVKGSSQTEADAAATASPATPSSVKATPVAATASGAATPAKSAKTAARAAVPAIPIVPVLPKVSPKSDRQAAATEKVQSEKKDQASQPTETEGDKPAATAGSGSNEAPAAPTEPKPKPAAVPGAPGAPRLWTGLFNKSSSTTPATVAVTGQAGVDGTAAADSASGTRGGVSNFTQSNNSSLAEALRAFRVGNGEKVAFLEPRGLINTGNMCYMNSVLQVLLFCIPFYDFLDQAGKKVTHSFKSETPLIDAMIEFMRDFKVIDSAVSVDQLRRRLKSGELEQYGEPFIPEFVYEAIKKLPRFSSMRRGHQQDAEEFLGFLLESLHDECAQVLRAAPAPASSNASTAPNSSAPTPTASVHSGNLDGGDPNNVWLEVGPRQRPAITRSSGHSDTSSPVTKIFGGQLRSELRVPGLKDSVTLEPYQPLQLDIGSPQVRNIVDALRGLTNPESLRGDFNSPRGKDVSATKQVFIESLPPVLILHLKRFQFDAEGNGTVKIWKKVGYPLELEIPREVFSRSKRNSSAGLPKYRLTAVVYHHGKNASGGHYTVDVRRQDDHEWIRLDDTVIRRIRSEDVAEAGAEEDPSRASASSSEPAAARKEAASAPTAAANRFAGMSDDAGDDNDGWKQVSGVAPGVVSSAAAGAKKWSSIVNGGSAGTASSAAAAKGGATGNSRQQQNLAKDSIKDNKVAYLLFYQRA